MKKSIKDAIERDTAPVGARAWNEESIDGFDVRDFFIYMVDHIKQYAWESLPDWFNDGNLVDEKEWYTARFLSKYHRLQIQNEYSCAGIDFKLYNGDDLIVFGQVYWNGSLHRLGMPTEKKGFGWEQVKSIDDLLKLIWVIEKLQTK